MSKLRKHYNPIYKFWEIQRERSSGLIEGHITWETLACCESEADADKEITQRQHEE